jgi:dehydrogenase/reductase SDR family member 7B
MVWIYLLGSILTYHLLYALYWQCTRPNFRGKRVLITGASSGIGEALAKRIAELGAVKLWLVSRRKDQLERVAKICQEAAKAAGHKCETGVRTLDLNEKDSCLNFAKSFPEPIDILINNGGQATYEFFQHSDMSVMDRIMNINFFAGVALIKGFLPSFLKHAEKGEKPIIVNILSVAGLIGVPMRTVYSASKFALDGFGKALAAELSDTGISVLQIYPAYIRTNVSKNALMGDATSHLGVTDLNVENGIPVDEAVEDMVKGIYLRRS